MARTNIVIDDALIASVRRTTGLKTKTEIVDFALRTLLRHNVVGRIRKYRRSGAWSGDLAAMRAGRG